MREQRLSMEQDSVEAMQRNLRHGEPAIFAGYGLVGAIVLLGGVGLLIDSYLGTKPWCLLGGLLLGLCLGFYELAYVLRRH